MQSRTRLSVALCTYNGGRFLPEQLQSLATQERSPDELIVCDDASTDDTVKIVERFFESARFPVSLHVNEQRLGSTKNFEKALSLCSGGIIALADQDDIWQPEKLRLCERSLLRSQAAGVFTDAVVVDEQSRNAGYRLWQAMAFTRREQRRMRRGKSFDVLLKHQVVTGATFVFRSELQNLVLPIPKEWVHDGWIALLAAAASGLDIITSPTVSYRVHSGSQIGAPRRGWFQRLSADPTAIHEQDAYRYSLAIDRLIAKGFGSAATRLHGKVGHLKKRAELPQRGSARAIVVGRELIGLRYHRYSKGWVSAGKDLVRGPSTCASPSDERPRR